MNRLGRRAVLALTVTLFVAGFIVWPWETQPHITLGASLNAGGMFFAGWLYGTRTRRADAARGGG